MTEIKPDKKDQAPEPKDLIEQPKECSTPAEDIHDGHATDFPTSLNEDLEERIKDNPNRFIGCGG